MPLHRLFRRIGHPVLMLTTGGLVLGLLGALGGEVTLFKGLTQMQELPGLVATTTALGFLAMAGIKLLAMLVAATSGFRGGRIFPALFVGVALGFAIHQAWDAVPLAIAVSAGVVGIVVAATRNGWLSIFMAIAVVPQVSLLIPVVLATLAAWLIVTNRPPLLAPEEAGRADPRRACAVTRQCVTATLVVPPWVRRPATRPTGPDRGPAVRTHPRPRRTPARRRSPAPARS